MAKYDPLARTLRARPTATVRLTFAEIDDLVGQLPRSARVYGAWWANEATPRQVQKLAWRREGFEVETVDLSRETVTFRRSG